MRKKHFQQSCGCLLVGLVALGIAACAVARIVQEVNKRTIKAPEKVEQKQSFNPNRIMPSNCR